MTLLHNQRIFKSAIARFKSDSALHFINGVSTKGASTQTFTNTTPYDNSELCQVALGTTQDVDSAVAGAKSAFTAWSGMSGKQRGKILHKVADLIEKNAETIAVLESIDSGQAIKYMAKAAIRGAANFRFFADKASEAENGLSLPADEHMNYTVRYPLGPVAVITPWNTPFMLSTWKIAPALASGCTVVHKPAEWSPLTAVLLAKICHQAGLPSGVLNMVQGYGETVGKYLTEHAHIKAVAFVGESRTGSLIMAQGAPTLKRVHFELGGKNPVVVFDDADLDRALDAVVFMIYSLNGQRCTSSSRVLIQDTIYDDFTAKIKRRVAKLIVGHPLDPTTEVGPLIHTEHYNKVMEYFDIAKTDGAHIAIGGTHPNDLHQGCFVAPTLFTKATNHMRISQEEIFGPVLTAIPFTDEADALAIANDTAYGLSAYVWTNDTGKSLRMAHGIEAGMVWVNSENNRHLPSPFGGVKASGIGRDGGDYSFDFYMETKNICISFGEHRVPKIGK